ncbi:hypothetical protein N0V82_000126 [Gnomoniopsis sp. IMI 355080]|nr:hypothetical protein N0V82_000126 [Gnomoniopsis sp. IMI 355080]
MGNAPSSVMDSLEQGSNFNRDELERLRKRFMKLDKDNSGTIEREEFLSLPQINSNPLATRLISIFDEDGGGNVDFQEFVSGLSAFSSKGNKEQKLAFAFKVYDIDRDGYISNGELFIVLKMMVGSNLKDQQLQQIVDKTLMEADLDKDGKISFEEFKKMVENTDVSMSMTLGGLTWDKVQPIRYSRDEGISDPIGREQSYHVDYLTIVSSRHSKGHARARMSYIWDGTTHFAFLLPYSTSCQPRQLLDGQLEIIAWTRKGEHLPEALLVYSTLAPVQFHFSRPHRVLFSSSDHENGSHPIVRGQQQTQALEMGLVDFAIDLAAVLSASRTVASKHIALRGRQFDRYGRTSSIVATVRAKQRGAQTAGAGKSTPAAGQEGTTVQEPDAPRGTTPASAEVPTASGGERVQSTNSVPASVLLGSEGAVKEPSNLAAKKDFSRDHTPAPTPLQAAMPVVENESKFSAEDIGASKATKKQEKTDEESLPEGVNLDIFRTSRGSKLSPLWKGDRHGTPKESSVPRLVELGVFRKDRDSSILNELDSRSRAVVGNNSSPMDHTTQTTETTSRDLPDPRVDQISPTQESHRETEEVEVPRYPDPTVENATAKPAANHTETEAKVSKQEASQLGEMLKHELRESRVPSSRLGRIWNYGGLAAGLVTGAISEGFSRSIGGGGEGSLMLSPANMERLVAKLSTMRGAALKLGQMMSFQDSKMLPAPIQEVLQRVQDRADYMPAWQRDRVLTANLGPEWRELYSDFEEKPIAAASIGQVHRAVLKSNGARVAVKVQYPGVADSINSDLNNLRMLLAASKLLPKGLYLDKTIDNARVELGWECDYEREAQCAQRYRDLLATEDDVFLVPQIYPEASGKQVLTMEFMDGVGVTRIQSFTQDQRDWIGTQILRLCLREITEFHFMQTDPNWTNFLYNSERDRLVLLDFGASREYPERFITLYVQLLAAASRSDRDTVKALSEELGYLTGHESRTMLDAHIASVLTLAEPFLESAPEVYDFRDQTITERVKAQIPVMIRERLAPPPEETYSLHRKLSGAFLLCARLGSRVRCREMFENAVVRSKVLEKAG